VSWRISIDYFPLAFRRGGAGVRQEEQAPSLTLHLKEKGVNLNEVLSDNFFEFHFSLI
jgi:hypothetical protein